MGEHTDAVSDVQVEDGLLIYRYADGCTVDLSAARKVVSIGRSLVDRRMPTLVDIRGVRSVSAQAREYFSSEENLEISGSVGLLVGSAVSKMIGNFFLGLSRPSVPIRMFTDESAARAWLLGQPRND